MASRFRDFLNKAFANQAAAETRHTPTQSLSPQQGEKQRPRFTTEDHEAARREGFLDAWDEYNWVEGGRQATRGREKVKHMTRAQIQMDLEGEGLSNEEMGAASDEALHLPSDPYYKSVPSVQLPHDSYLLQAHISGMQNRLITVLNKLEEAGIDLSMDEEDIPDRAKDTYRWAQDEYNRLAERMAMCGVDIATVEEGIADGTIQQKNRVDPPDEEYIDTKLAGPTKGIYEKPESRQDSRSGEQENSSRSGGSRGGNTNHPGPMREGREHGIAIRQERLAELDDILESKGYTRQTDWRYVSAQDREMVRQVMVERENLYDDLREFQEDPVEVQQEIDASRSPRSSGEFEDDAREEVHEDSDETNTNETEDAAESPGDEWDNPAPEADGWTGGDPGDGFGEW